MVSPGVHAGSSVEPGWYGEPIAKMFAYAPRRMMKKKPVMYFGHTFLIEFNGVICVGVKSISSAVIWVEKS